MNKTNVALALVLALQVVILALMTLARDGDSGDAIETGALLDVFDASSVEQVEIVNPAGDSLILVRQDGGWVMPDVDDFPATAGTIDALLSRLALLQTDRLIAENATSHNQLGVGETNNEGQIILDGETRLYIGNSAGSDATHVRLDGSDQVYLVSGLSAADTNIASSNWTDTLYFSVLPQDIVGIQIENANGVINLAKDDTDTWALTDITDDETFNPAAVDGILPIISGIRFTRPLGTEITDDMGLNDPQATVTLTVREQINPGESNEVPAPDATQEPLEVQYEEVTYTLMLGAELDLDQFAFLSSDSEYVVLVATFTADPILEAMRDNFLVVTEAESTDGVELENPVQEPEAPPQNATAEPTEEVTSEATVEPTEEVSPEVTIEPTESVTSEPTEEGEDSE